MILALDLGLRRIGVARSRSGVLAEAVQTIALKRGLLNSAAGQAEALSALRSIIGQEPLERLVIGLPYLANGQLSDFAEELRPIADQLGQALGVPTDFEDETLTTVAGQLDHEAARLILEQYLAHHPA